VARAHSILILRRQDTRTIIRVWTVKHEMVSWLSKNDRIRRQDAEVIYEVVRMRDAHVGCETIVPWKEIPWV